MSSKDGAATAENDRADRHPGRVVCRWIHREVAVHGRAETAVRVRRFLARIFLPWPAPPIDQRIRARLIFTFPADVPIRRERRSAFDEKKA